MFQFLNGLDEEYGVHRSQLLMMNPLPSVDTTCSTLQQEEDQKEVLKFVKEENEEAAMLSKRKRKNVGLLWDFQTSMAKVEKSTKGR